MLRDTRGRKPRRRDVKPQQHGKHGVSCRPAFIQSFHLLFPYPSGLFRKTGMYARSYSPSRSLSPVRKKAFLIVSLA